MQIEASPGSRRASGAAKAAGLLALLFAGLSAPASSQGLTWIENPTNGHLYALTAPKSWDAADFPKQNMLTYTVGFTTTQQMLSDAASYGHGAYY